MADDKMTEMLEWFTNLEDPMMILEILNDITQMRANDMMLLGATGEQVRELSRLLEVADQVQMLVEHYELEQSS